MNLHRNSQKRYYIGNGVYFITTNTYDGYPYFAEDIFCDLFVENIKYCQKIKPFELFAYKINPDHVHLLMQPTGKFNVSQIMHNIKRVNSIQINQIINCVKKTIPIEGGDIYLRLRWNERMIRNRKDLINHIKYIQNQWIKHELKENKYCFINQEICA